MEVTLTPIGNSQGIRIPQAILKQVGFTDTATLTIKNRSLILSPAKPRQTWDKQFSQKTLPDSNLIPLTTLINDFDHKDWQW